MQIHLQDIVFYLLIKRLKVIDMSKTIKKKQLEQSFRDLYRIYQPDDLDKFTMDFIKKYKIPKDYADRLKALVSKDKE